MAEISEANTAQLLFAVTSLTAEVYGIRRALVAKGVLDEVDLARSVQRVRDEMNPEAADGLAILERLAEILSRLKRGV